MNQELTNIAKEGILESSSLQFATAEVLVPLHLYRYNNQIQKLIKVQEIDEDEVDGEIITWKMFYAARNRKIKAYMDCVDTLVQKEFLLQYHNRDFNIEINIYNTVEIKEEIKPRLNPENLTLDEAVELMNLFDEMQVDDHYAPQSISVTNTGVNEVTEDVEHEIIEAVNVEVIKHEQLPASQLTNNSNLTLDSSQKLRNNIEKILAAKKFKEAGIKLTEEEEELIK